MNRVASGSSALVAGVAAGVLLCLAAPAHAISLRDILGGARTYDGRVAEPPPIARYAVEDEGSFVLDRSGPTPLLRFDGSYEIWALKAGPAARGDIIYRNDVGQPVLRATRLGGVTVFTPKRPSGAAAALVGATSPLELRLPVSPGALLQVLGADSARANRVVRHPVEFEAPEVNRASAPWVADAANICAKAIEARGESGEGRGGLASLKIVRVRVGAAPDARFSRGVLELVVNPDEGPAGRPSSRRIEKALR